MSRRKQLVLWCVISTFLLSVGYFPARYAYREYVCVDLKLRKAFKYACKMDFDAAEQEIRNIASVTKKFYPNIYLAAINSCREAYMDSNQLLNIPCPVEQYQTKNYGLFETKLLQFINAYNLMRVEDLRSQIKYISENEYVFEVNIIKFLEALEAYLNKDFTKTLTCLDVAPKDFDAMIVYNRHLFPWIKLAFKQVFSDDRLNIIKGHCLLEQSNFEEAKIAFENIKRPAFLSSFETKWQESANLLYRFFCLKQAEGAEEANRQRKYNEFAFYSNEFYNISTQIPENRNLFASLLTESKTFFNKNDTVSWNIGLEFFKIFSNQTCEKNKEELVKVVMDKITNWNDLSVQLIEFFYDKSKESIEAHKVLELANCNLKNNMECLVKDNTIEISYLMNIVESLSNKLNEENNCIGVWKEAFNLVLTKETDLNRLESCLNWIADKEVKEQVKIEVADKLLEKAATTWWHKDKIDNFSNMIHFAMGLDSNLAYIKDRVESLTRFVLRSAFEYELNDVLFEVSKVANKYDIKYPEIQESDMLNCIEDVRYLVQAKNIEQAMSKLNYIEHIFPDHIEVIKCKELVNIFINTQDIVEFLA